MIRLSHVVWQIVPDPWKPGYWQLSTWLEALPFGWWQQKGKNYDHTINIISRAHSFLFCPHTMSLCQLALQKLKFLNKIELSLITNGRLWLATKFGFSHDFVTVSRGILQTGSPNLAKFSAENCGPQSSAININNRHACISIHDRVTSKWNIALIKHSPWHTTWYHLIIWLHANEHNGYN